MNKEVIERAIKHLRAHQMADQALLFALIATHPDLAMLQRGFHHYSEQAKAVMLASPADQVQIDLLDIEVASVNATLQSQEVLNLARRLQTPQ